MKILITGAKGFVGKNLSASLPEHELYRHDVDSDLSLLDYYCRDADFVFHLAGVNRPKDPKEFMEGNFGFTSVLLETLKKHGNTCPVTLSSSTQAALDNPYGQSKAPVRIYYEPIALKQGQRSLFTVSPICLANGAVQTIIVQLLHSATI